MNRLEFSPTDSLDARFNYLPADNSSELQANALAAAASPPSRVDTGSIQSDVKIEKSISQTLSQEPVPTIQPIPGFAYQLNDDVDESTLKPTMLVSKRIITGVGSIADTEGDVAGSRRGISTRQKIGITLALIGGALVGLVIVLVSSSGSSETSTSSTTSQIVYQPAPSSSSSNGPFPIPIVDEQSPPTASLVQPQPPSSPVQQVAPLVSGNQILTSCQSASSHALTIDSTPNVETTSTLLDLLDRYQVPATFFVSPWHPDEGPWNDDIVAQRCHLVRDIVSRGYDVQSQGFDAVKYWKMSPNEIRQEVERGNEWVRSCSGSDVYPRYFRAPQEGLSDANVDFITNQLGLTIINWNVDGLNHGVATLDSTSGSKIVRLNEKALQSSMGSLDNLIPQLESMQGNLVSNLDQCLVASSS
jgi:hypothetical protein